MRLTIKSYRIPKWCLEFPIIPKTFPIVLEFLFKFTQSYPILFQACAERFYWWWRPVEYSTASTYRNVSQSFDQFKMCNMYPWSTSIILLWSGDNPIFYLLRRGFTWRIVRSCVPLLHMISRNLCEERGTGVYDWEVCRTWNFSLPWEDGGK